jgi:hypothetical protein
MQKCSLCDELFIATFLTGAVHEGNFSFRVQLRTETSFLANTQDKSDGKGGGALGYKVVVPFPATVNNFLSTPQLQHRLWCSASNIYTRRQAFYRVGVKQPRGDADHWLPSSVDIKNSGATPKLKLHGLSPRANYTDRATAACRRSDCQLLRIEGATWSAWWIPTAVFSVSRQEPLHF